MRAGGRWVWVVIGSVLLVGGLALAAASIAAFTRVPDAELGDTKDLALGFLLGLLALVGLGGGIGCFAALRPRPSGNHVGDAADMPGPAPRHGVTPPGPATEGR